MDTYTASNVQHFIAAWTKYLRQKQVEGKRLYFLSALYKPIKGTDANIRRRMFLGMEDVFEKLQSRMFSDPWDMKVANERPVFLCCLDWPVIKKSAGRHAKNWDTRMNGGAHLHALGIMPKRSELGCGLQKHFRQDGGDYLGRTSPLIDIDAERIRDRLPFVTDYALKGLKRTRKADDWLILPTSRGEAHESRH